jgi:hypothetical protein
MAKVMRMSLLVDMVVVPLTVLTWDAMQLSETVAVVGPRYQFVATTQIYT